MDLKDTPESEISTARIDSEESKTGQTQGSTKKIEPSHLKKNEFALILFGALLLTAVIFFLLFRSSDTTVETQLANTSNPSLTDLANRVADLENALEILGNTGGVSDTPDAGGVTGIGPVKERVTSLETAFSVKFDSLLKRMETIEKSVSGLEKKPFAVTKSKPEAIVKKAGLFHSIKKGETLYAISTKYNTTVKNIRKLNKLSINAQIYPGDSILIR